jgi:putative Holliday junction resolvase
MKDKGHKNRNYLGVDWGEKRIGLAIGNSENKVAIPFKVITNLNELKNVIEDVEIDTIVLGMPSKLDQKKSRSYREVEKFISELRKIDDIEIKTIDERFTSKAVDSLGGTEKTKAAKDAVAAMLILQTYFDRN